MMLYVLIKGPQNLENLASAQEISAYEKAAQEIMKAVGKMKPTSAIRYTPGSNNIFIDNTWKAEEILQNLETIKNMENVANYYIYSNLLAELEIAVMNHDFIKAYPLGCTLFETYGSSILRGFFKRNGVPVGQDSMRIGVNSIIIMLYTHKLIDTKTFQTMIKINRIRNNIIVHGDKIQNLNQQLIEILDHIDSIQTCAKSLATMDLSNNSVVT